MAIVLKWIIILLASMNSLYMIYDGSRALITGDYLRPKSGEYAGQLGPWSKLAEKIGIDPMSTLMKCIFLFFGIAGLIVTIGFMMDLSWSWKTLLIFNICTTWNLFFGTASGILQIVLLLVLKAIR
jgi:hypothetical protein